MHEVKSFGAAASHLKKQAACVLALGLAAFHTAAGAQQVVVGAEGMIRVEAHDVPLSQLLDELATVMPLDSRVAPESAAIRVTVSQPLLPPLDALGALLKQAGVDYLLVGGVAGRPARVIVDMPRQPAAVGPARGSAIPPAAESSPRESQAAIEVASRDDEPADQVEAARVESPEEQKAKLDQLVASMRVTPKPPRRGTLELPFPGADGRPLTIHSDAKPTDDYQLPFPGEDGQSPRTIPRPRSFSVDEPAPADPPR